MRSARRLAAGLVVASAATGVFAQTTAGKTCPGDMCITATANASTTIYKLEYTGRDVPGWMAIGFGQGMVESPMVILWTNSDGSVTMSQRVAANYIMPTPIRDPPRVATVDATGTNAKAAKPTFVFAIPTDPDTQTKQTLIWGIGASNPGSSNPDADIVEHIPGQNGIVNLAVNTPVKVDTGGSSGTGGSGNSTTGSGSSTNGTSGDGSGNEIPTQSGSLPPLTYSQKLIVAHAVLFSIAFLLLLPAGALVARLLRAWSPHWFKGHWIIQFYLTTPLLIAGLATAIACVSKRQGDQHFDDDHKRVGLALIILYVIQCSLGAFIHWIKDPNRTRRPPQNYFHAILGITIIILALVQVRTGYKSEWPSRSGRGAVSSSVNTWWIVWVVLLPLLYFGGLAFLPRQFNNERRQLEEREAREYAMQRSGSRRRRAEGRQQQNNDSFESSNGHAPKF